MKRSLMLIMLLVASATVWAQTIYTADNNPGAIGGVNIFTGVTALQDAIATASSGDIIHIVRSATDYGATTVDKQLTLYGIGLNPDTDGSERSKIGILTISDPAASGTRISGLNITNQLALGGVAGALNNLLIENSRIRWIQHASAGTTLSNIIIRNNVIGSSFITTEEKIDLLAGSIANIVISNNVFYSNNFNGNGAINASNGTSIENNLFIGAGNTAIFAFESFNGNSVKNNIFYGLQPQGAVSLNNNTFKNNLTYLTGNAGSDTFSTTNGNTSTNNVEGQNPLFTNVPTGISIDYSTFDPALLVGSPAIGSGEGGTDMGVFGGPLPMSLEGTLIPTIQSITFPTTVVKGDSLAVQIKAKGN